ncbi:MAG: glycosyltransferase [bacterium]|nr:glycosyltransferase [bacterium]
MSKVSIIIPSRAEIQEVSLGETVLQRTVRDIYEKATDDFEVLVGFDGPPYQDFPDYPNLKVVKFPSVVGIKTGINALAAMAQGKYIYKTDAHCSFGKGFDEILQADMEDNWIVMPRFYVLNGETWEWQDERFYDYFYLCCPFTDPKGFRFKAGGHWPERTAEKLDILIDETPQIHGSGWFIAKDYYFNYLGGFPNIDPYGHAQEPIWLGLKNWLGGGKVMVNKKTWYAHMHQQGNKRGYHMGHEQEKISYDLAAKYWVGDKWHERKHDFSWFVEKFMPMPTWPENWEELCNKWRLENK